MMEFNESELLDTVCWAVESVCDIPVDARPEHRLIDDLQFDSLLMTSLAVELESEFSQPILLSDWIASATDLSMLTVKSLADHLRLQLEDED